MRYGPAGAIRVLRLAVLSVVLPGCDIMAASDGASGGAVIVAVTVANSAVQGQRVASCSDHPQNMACVRCSNRIEITATGDPGSVAAWQRAHFRWTRLQSGDSWDRHMSRSEIRDFLDAATVKVGQTHRRTMNGSVGGQEGWREDGTLFYTTADGAEHEASFTWECR